jgi:chemotaxis receptor (MCP) glutamine deamidase CheD
MAEEFKGEPKAKPEEMLSEEEKERQTIPELEDSEDFVWVLQNQYGATKAESNNPVIKTFGLQGCVGIILFDPDAKVGTLAHLAPSITMQDKIQRRLGRTGHLIGEIHKLLYTLEDNGSRNTSLDNRKRLQATLVGIDPKTLTEIGQGMEASMYPPPRLHDRQDIRSIALDTRNGQNNFMV